MIGLFDPVWLLFVGPPMLLALWAQYKVKSSFAAASRVPNSRGMSGAEAARAILDANGLRRVTIEPVEGQLSDHYDPKDKVLRLSPDVYGGRSLAAVGIAAHEAGHALQDAQDYGPLVVRNGLVPLAATGGQLSMWMIMGGFLLMALANSPFGLYILYAGIAAFAVTVVFQLVNLPVEFNASSRARVVLAEMGVVTEQEMPTVSGVLNAAAMTYVAATLIAVMQLLYFLYRSGLLGGRE